MGKRIDKLLENKDALGLLRVSPVKHILYILAMQDEIVSLSQRLKKLEDQAGVIKNSK